MSGARVKQMKAWRGPVVVIAAAALLLAGCTNGSEDSKDGQDEATVSLGENITFEEVELPASLSTGSTGVGWFSAVSEAGDAPRLAVSPIFHGKTAEANVGLWQGRGTDLFAEAGEVEVAGDVVTTDVAYDDGLTAIAGRTVADGKARTYLLTSADRSTWQAVELDEAASAVAATSVAVADRRIYLLGAGADGRAPQLVAYDTASGTSTVADLPAPEEGDELSLAGVGAIGQRVVVITESGPAGEDVRPEAHVSEDGGLTFTTEPLHGDTFDINDIVTTGEEFIAVGGVSTSGFVKPAAWTSLDGVSWSVDNITDMWDWDPMEWSRAQANVEFTSATYDHASGIVAATMTNDDSLMRGSIIRHPGGRWEGRLYLDSDGSNPQTVSMQIGEDHTLAVSSFTFGSARQAIMDINASDVLEEELVAYDVEPEELSVFDLGDTAAVVAKTPKFEVSESGWRSSATTAQSIYTVDGGFVESGWMPADAPEESSPFVATDTESGQAVLVTPFWDGDRFSSRTWLRDETGEWTEGDVLASSDADTATAVSRNGEGWSVASQTVDLDTRVRTLTMWSSSDGTTWSTQDVTQPFDASSTIRVNAICDTPAGAFAVGMAADETRAERATAWHYDGSVWEPAVLGAAGSSASSCAATDDGVTVLGQGGAGTLAWGSADGVEYADVDLSLGAGEEIHDIVAVDGGYVASGSAHTTERFGPVLWLSTDAREWVPVPVPVSSRHTSGLQVAQVGSDLLLTDHGSLRAWRVPDIASVFGE